MRIAQIAPLTEAIPPKLYGGTERVVSWLTEELVALGHDVTLFASGDSVTSAKLHPVWPKAIRLSRPPPDPFAAYTVLTKPIAPCEQNFELVHSHCDWIHLPVLARTSIPFVTSFHGRLDQACVR